MKINNIIRLVSFCFCAVAVLSCEVTENLDEHTADETLVHKIFHATIEDGGMTKTMLDENVVDGVRGLMWDPGDEIGIGIHGSTFRKFTNICTEATSNGVFEGEISESNTYYAIYPWRDNMTMTTEIFVNIPSRQTYRANSFDINMAPMVGRGNNEESIHFQNLCGILTLNLKGTDKISSITVTAKDVRGNKAFLSGDFSVDMGYETFPYPMPTEEALTDIILDCKEGVQLDSETETSFNVIIPPGKYYGLELQIVTTDGKFMKKSTSNTLEIKRSVITKSRGFEFEDNLSGTVVTLNTYGHSNCYVVSSAGVYSFDATVIGNGEFGMVPGANFHTDSPDIAPASVELLWEDRAGLIGGYAYDAAAGEVKFIASGKEGNALFAVKDEEGNILWSWHIWMTDQPVDQTYVNSAGTFVVQDRNLGATRADRGSGDEWKESYGAIYQWGRKDPFIKNTYELIRSPYHDRGPFSISQSVQNPTKMGSMPNGVSNRPSWLSVKNNQLWTYSVKTIYDPCPAGYRVPDTNVWKGFTSDGNNASILESINASSVKDYGFDFIYDGINSTWYPVTPMVGWYGSYEEPYKTGRLWTTVSEKSFKYETSPAITFDDTECWAIYAIPVRCMKDEGHVDISTVLGLSSPEVSEISMTSARISCSTKYGYSLNIAEKGFIVGTLSDLSDGFKVICDGGQGEFSYTLEALSPNTLYYIQSYAVTETGVINSDIIGFKTYFSNSVSGYNLSNGGTANCYIVSEPGDYCLNASVKGNSSESIGLPVEAEVLWESVSCTGKADSGTIVSSVRLNGNHIEFSVLSPLQEGNALIAVRDVAGTILWSWHIWITDMPEEQEYINSYGNFVVQDRNLGATRADRGSGDEWKQSCGIDYYWGRKDPFMGYCHTSSSSSYTIAETINNPTVKYTSWGDGPSSNLWSPHSKTIYDPCPVGYRVAPNDIWAGFSLSLVSGEFNQGWNFIYNDSGDTAWYSNRAAHNPSNIDYWGDNYMACSVQYSGLYISSYSIGSRSVGCAALRCMKDE